MQQNKKITLDNHYNQFSGQNFLDVMDGGSRRDSFFPDESMGNRVYAAQLYEESRNFVHLENHQNTNTINFWDQNRKMFSREPYDDKESVLSEESINFDMLPKRVDPCGRGLKYLAFLIYRTLKKKSFDSADELSKYIQNYLKKKAKNHKQSQESDHQSSKLVSSEKASWKSKPSTRRRIYDAINVMIAVGLVNKKKAKIQIKDQNQTNPISNISFNNPNKSVSELHKKLSDKYSKLQFKRKLLAQKHEQNNILECIVRRNKEQCHHVTNRINFPFITLYNKSQLSRIQINQRNSMLEMNYNPQQIEISGDIDALSSYLYQNQVQVKNFFV